MLPTSCLWKPRQTILCNIVLMMKKEPLAKLLENLWANLAVSMVLDVAYSLKVDVATTVLVQPYVN